MLRTRFAQRSFAVACMPRRSEPAANGPPDDSERRNSASIDANRERAAPIMVLGNPFDAPLRARWLAESPLARHRAHPRVERRHRVPASRRGVRSASKALRGTLTDRL